MKIAITGHSAGIGLACASVMGKNHDVIGLSRSNGFDISNVQQIADAANDADVFINNAYCDYQQSYLLDEMFKRWQYQDKIIVNIGSSCTVYPRTEEHLNHLPWPYRDHKKSLETLFRYLIKQPKQCALQLISPGPVDTQMIKHLDCKKIDPVHIANTIVKNLGNDTEIILHA